MNDRDLINDAVDAEIQAAISRSRGNTLSGLKQMPVAPGVPEENEDSMYEAMLQEDEAEQAAKSKQGGGGLGGILKSVMG